MAQLLARMLGWRGCRAGEADGEVGRRRGACEVSVWQ